MEDQKLGSEGKNPSSVSFESLVSQVRRMLNSEAYHYCGDCHTHCRQTILAVEALKESERVNTVLAEALSDARQFFHPQNGGPSLKADVLRDGIDAALALRNHSTTSFAEGEHFSEDR